jgi:protein-disulfide isomerase
MTDMTTEQLEAELAKRRAAEEKAARAEAVKAYKPFTDLGFGKTGATDAIPALIAALEAGQRNPPTGLGFAQINAALVGLSGIQDAVIRQNFDGVAQPATGA